MNDQFGVVKIRSCVPCLKDYIGWKLLQMKNVYLFHPNIDLLNDYIILKKESKSFLNFLQKLEKDKDYLVFND